MFWYGFHRRVWRMTVEYGWRAAGQSIHETARLIEVGYRAYDWEE